MTRIDVLGVGFDPVDLDGAHRAVERLLENGGPHLVVTANVELVMRARDAPDLRAVLDRAALVVADGVGVVWGARQLGRSLPARVAGIDLASRLCADAPVRGWRVCLLGGAAGVADEAAAHLRRAYPGLDVIAAGDGYFSPAHDPEVVEVVRACTPALLLVGLGSPRQERWLDRHLAALGARVAMGIGGSLDVWAGRVARAPGWVQRLGLEWCYRLLRQPSRLRRQLAIPRFMAAVWRARARG